MPTVPYNPVQPGEPGNVPIPYRTDAGVSPTAFGAGIGTAMEHLGGEAEKTADMLERNALSLQDLANRASTDKADTQFMTEAGAEHAKFNAMEGGDRAAYYPTYQKNLTAIRERIRGTLPNAMTQRMYDSQTLRTLGQTIFNGAGLAATGAHQDAIQSIEGRIAAQTNLAASLKDPQAIEEAKDDIRALSVTHDHLKGITDQRAIDGNANTAASKIDRDYLDHLSRTDLDKAQDEFDKRRKKMSEPDQKYVQDLIDNKQNSVGATGIADEVMAANEVDGELKASYKVLEEQARQKARERAPDNAALEQHSVQQLKSMYNQKKYGDIQEKNESMQTIAALVEGGARTKAAIMDDPKGSAAVMSLPATDRNNLDKKIGSWVAAREKNHNDEMMTQLAGMRMSAHDEFLMLDPFDEKYNLNQLNIRTILNQQRIDLKARPQDDPRPWHALSTLKAAMGPQLQTLGLYKRAGNEDAFDHFMGSLTTALDSWQQTHNDRPASNKDVIETIGPSLIKQATVPGRLWGTNVETFFQQAPTDAFSKSYLRDNPDADSEEVQKEFNRARLLQLYSAPAQKVKDRWPTVPPDKSPTPPPSR
jgi:hypothetical protein